MNTCEKYVAKKCPEDATINAFEELKKLTLSPAVGFLWVIRPTNTHKIWKISEVDFWLSSQGLVKFIQ